MGLYDRDYMRNRHKASNGGHKHFKSVITGSDWQTWKIVLLTIAALALLVIFSKRHMDSRPDTPFPPTGEVRWFVSPPANSGAPLIITAPNDGKRNYAVRLNDWNTGGLVAIIPIRGGELAEVEVPLGRYQVTIASGKRWQGPEQLFGISGDVKKVVAPMDFYRTGSQSTGNRIDLKNRLNGNMETRAERPFEK